MDYTQYKFSYQGEKEKKRAVKKDGLGAVISAIILLVFVVSVLLSTRLIGRDIIGETVSALSRENKVKYYVVVLNKTEFISDANAYSKKVRSSGGAGYIFSENNAYFVALATYTNEKDAKAVASKNDKTEVKEIVFDLKKYLDKVTDDGESKRALLTLFSSIDELIDLTFSYDEKTLTFDGATRRAEVVKNELIKLKMELTEKSLKNGEELLSFISPILAVTQDLTEENLTKNLRYGVCETLDKM